MGFFPQSKGEWFLQAKRGLYVLALVGYVLLLMEGMSTGLGVYRNPTACWLAACCAVIALACASKAQRWLSVMALMLSIAGAFYGYQQNAVWKERLERIHAKQLSSPHAQTETNK
jgi:hypothetical protein